MRLKSSLLSAAMLAVAAASLFSAAPAFASTTSQVDYNAAGTNCVLNASGAGTCVIPGLEIVGSTPYMGYTSLINSPPAAVLTSVTSTSPLISVLSFGCSYLNAVSTPCDVLIGVQSGAVQGGVLQGTFNYSYNVYENFNASNPSPGPASSTTTVSGNKSVTTNSPPAGYTGYYIVNTYHLSNQVLSNFLTTSVGDPYAQRGQLYYAYNGSPIGNSADVTANNLMAVGNIYPYNPTAAVPAPGPLGLLFLGLGGALLLSRRRLADKAGL